MPKSTLPSNLLGPLNDRWVIQDTSKRVEASGSLVGRGIAFDVNETVARGVGFEPTCPFGHGISNPTPYQARRPPRLARGAMRRINVNVVFSRGAGVWNFKATS